MGLPLIRVMLLSYFERFHKLLGWYTAATLPPHCKSDPVTEIKSKANERQPYAIALAPGRKRWDDGMAVDGRTRRRRLHRFDDGAFLGSGEISSRGWPRCARPASPKV